MLTTPTPFPGLASAVCDGCRAKVTVEAVNPSTMRERRLKAKGVVRGRSSGDGNPKVALVVPGVL